MNTSALLQMALILAAVPVFTEMDSDQACKAVHDVAITDISAPPSCNQGNTVPIRVTVTNQGTLRETFHVTLTDEHSGVEITSREVTLAQRWSGKKCPSADLVFTGEKPSTQQFANYVTAGDVNKDVLARSSSGKCFFGFV